MIVDRKPYGLLKTKKEGPPNVSCYNNLILSNATMFIKRMQDAQCIYHAAIYLPTAGSPWRTSNGPSTTKIHWNQIVTGWAIKFITNPHLQIITTHPLWPSRPSVEWHSYPGHVAWSPGQLVIAASKLWYPSLGWWWKWKVVAHLEMLL